MRLSRLVITNFRNLARVDVPLSEHVVVVGENRAGKSNLLHALRLVLDPSLSSVQRTLTSDDFSASLGANPMSRGETIEVHVELEGFDSHAGLLAILSSAIISGSPLRARLTYRFGPREGWDGQGQPVYDWSITGGTRDERIGSDLRRYLHHVHMPALRDAENDLRSWRRSPLRPLLDEVAHELGPEDLERLRDALQAANSVVSALQGVQGATDRIRRETEALAGALHLLQPTLSPAVIDPSRAVRSLHLLLDGLAQRSLSSSSLGALNVLYLALLRLQLESELRRGAIEHAVISIEEPEAHLHPHLQRRMFRGLDHGDAQDRTTVVTTHSPHIVSVVSPQELLVLRDADGVSTAWAAITANLSPQEWDDLGRYLDATRSELVFARRVLLVEGFAEQVLMPRLAEGRVDLDEHGISVCSVHGVHFSTYVRFLRALGTPHAVITDGDPTAGAGRTGPERVRRLATRIGADPDNPEAAGLFMGGVTFEADLFDAYEENQGSMVEVLAALLQPGPAADLRAEYEAGLLDGAGLLRRLGGLKGRFAQRLAARAERLRAPGYIERAVAHVLA